MQRSSNVVLPDWIWGCVEDSFGGRAGSFCVLATGEVVRATVFRCSDACFASDLTFNLLLCDIQAMWCAARLDLRMG